MEVVGESQQTWGGDDGSGIEGNNEEPDTEISYKSRNRVKVT